jgi:phenylalanyl-tRNA synthetase alpha chain
MVLQAVHEHGGYGSAGYGYHWKLAEASKNLLRTHTTAVSSRMLHKLAQVCYLRVPTGMTRSALTLSWQQRQPPVFCSRLQQHAVCHAVTLCLQEGFKPAKYFSIDRVFRNEAVDRTHLAEFHQVEGEPCGLAWQGCWLMSCPDSRACALAAWYAVAAALTLH